MPAKERVRIGGRSARIQTEVHKAVASLSRERGRGDLTIPMIAARAGVTPSTIYRRWGDLSELLSDVAVERLRPAADPLDTGSLRGDIQAWAEQYMEEMSSELGQAMLRDVLATTLDTRKLSTCLGYTTGDLEAIVERAKQRGEPGVDVDSLVDHIVSPITYHVLFGQKALTPDYCRALVERALASAGTPTVA